MEAKNNTLSSWWITWGTDVQRNPAGTVQQAYPNVYDASIAFHALSLDFTAPWRLDQHCSLPHLSSSGSRTSSFITSFIRPVEALAATRWPQRTHTSRECVKTLFIRVQRQRHKLYIADNIVLGHSPIPKLVIPCTCAFARSTLSPEPSTYGENLHGQTREVVSTRSGATAACSSVHARDRIFTSDALTCTVALMLHEPCS